MKNNLINDQHTGLQIIRYVLSVLALLILFAAALESKTARAESDAQFNANRFARISAPKTNYKIVITSESKASGWNSATLKLGCKSDGGTKDVLTWDLKDEFSKGDTITKTFSFTMDDIPYRLRLYLDFGGGFSVRSHSGRIKFYADDEEVMNEKYSAQSYPFVSSDETLDFGIYGIAPTIVISSGGQTNVYSSVQQAWNKAKDMDGCTVRLWEDSSVRGTLEVSKKMTVDFNGHLLNNTETTSLFLVKSTGNLSLIDSDPTRDTGEYFICTSYPYTTYRLKGGGVLHGGSEGDGGAIEVEKNGKLSIKGCTFTNCRAAGSGGAINTRGDVNLNGTHFIYCIAGKNGGAIGITGTMPKLSFENLTFDDCRAGNGGAICTYSIKSVESEFTKLDNCTFNRCIAAEYGGGLLFTSKIKGKANNLKFIQCEAEYGGGLYRANDGPLTVNDSKFEQCKASESGGGMAYRYGGDTSFNNVEFSECSSQEYGGAIYVLSTEKHSNMFNDRDYSRLYFDNCNIHNCSSEKEGGGVYVNDEGSDTDKTNKTMIRYSTIQNNKSKVGGGVYIESRFVYIVDSKIINNQAGSKNGGGGIYVDSMRDAEVAGRITIQNNTANGEVNNVCLQNGTFSTAYLYCGGLYDGSYIGISTTSNSRAVVVKNISRFQANKFLYADDTGRTFSMTNTRMVETPLYASMISENISMYIVIGGIVMIVGAIAFLFIVRHRKEGKKTDETEDEQTGRETVDKEE